MKQYKYFIWILIIFNIILLVLVLYMRFGKYNKGISINDYNKVVNALKNTNQYQKNLRLFQLYTEQRLLPPDIEVIAEKGDTLPLISIVKQPVLVLRYSELNCQTCVDALIAILRKEKRLDLSNTLLLAYYKEPVYLYQFKRMNRLELPVYGLRYSNLPPDTLNIPYFFLLNQNMQVSNVYIPEEKDTSELKNYLTFIGKRINNDKSK